MDDDVTAGRGMAPMSMWRARMLDLRSYISALFAIFGVLVTVTGARATPAELEKSAGMNLSLWTGIAMLILSGVFLTWLLAVPPDVPEPAIVADDPSTVDNEF